MPYRKGSSPLPQASCTSVFAPHLHHSEYMLLNLSAFSSLSLFLNFVISIQHAYITSCDFLNFRSHLLTSYY